MKGASFSNALVSRRSGQTASRPEKPGSQEACKKKCCLTTFHLRSMWEDLPSLLSLTWCECLLRKAGSIQSSAAGKHCHAHTATVSKPKKKKKITKHLDQNAAFCNQIIFCTALEAAQHIRLHLARCRPTQVAEAYSQTSPLTSCFSKASQPRVQGSADLALRTSTAVPDGTSPLLSMGQEYFPADRFNIKSDPVNVL